MSSSQSPIAQAAAVTRALSVLLGLWLVSPAQAASIHIIDENGKQGIVIEGPIVKGDDDQFSQALENVRDKSNTFVFLSSAGGNGITGVLIGDLVRRSGMLTAVLEGKDCASACAMIWIAGARRMASKNACIGFHGMYDPASGQPSADANAVAGAHLGLLGLSLDAVFWMLTPRQLDTHWLTDETAENYGIYWMHAKDDPGHRCPNQRGEARRDRRDQDNAHPPTGPNIATYCIPQAAAEGPDPITQISVSLSPGVGTTVSFNVAHRSLGGSIYERPKQYHVYTSALANGTGWQWLGQKLSDINTWMVGQLTPTGDRSYRYREWIYHADPRIIGFDKGESVTVAACGEKPAG